MSNPSFAATTPKLKIYNFSKKMTSTKRPEDASLSPVGTYDFKLKGGALDWRSPVIQVSSSGQNALSSGGCTYAIIENYQPFQAVQSGQKVYYYIDNIVFKSNRVMVFYLNLDVLATYRSVIGNMGGIVNYCNNPDFFNSELDDPRMMPGYWKRKLGNSPKPTDLQFTGSDSNTHDVIQSHYFDTTVFGVPVAGQQEMDAGNWAVITKVVDVGISHIYYMSYTQFIALLVDFLNWLIQQATADVPSKDWKYYFLCAWAYPFNHNNSPFLSGGSMSGLFDATTTFEVAGQDFTSTGTIYKAKYRYLYTSHIADSVGLMQSAGNMKISDDGTKSFGDIPYFMKKSKYRKISVISPWDTQVIDQDKYDCNFMWIKSYCMWDTNNFYIVGRQPINWSTSTTEDSNLGNVIYKANGELGLDILSIIDFNTVTSDRAYHRSISGLGGQVTDTIAQTSAGIPGKTARLIKYAVGTPANENESVAAGETAQRLISNLPIIGKVFERFDATKKYYDTHAGVTGAVKPVDTQDWLGVDALTEGHGLSSVTRHRWQLNVVYTQTIPAALDYYQFGKSESLFTKGNDADDVANRYYNFGMRWGFPMFYKVDKISDMHFRSSQVTYSYVASKMRNEVYVEMSDQLFPYDMESWSALPQDIKLRIIDALTKGIWYYDPQPS